MKVGIIVAYFGHLPSYFQIFLDSCQYNKNFEWIILTDDETEYVYPDNVRRIVMTFFACREKIQDCFNFPIALNEPKKLCDYKCAYGYIFQEYLKEYDWWGHCDIDQIFGDIGKFITTEKLEKYDKIGSLGHLTLYRNCAANNQVFMSLLDGHARWKEVFTDNRGFAFDEWEPGNINEIFLNSGRNFLVENVGADVNPYRTTFQLTAFDMRRGCYTLSPIKNTIFSWEKGKLFCIYDEKGIIEKKEIPYVHLQKRKMKDKRSNVNRNGFYIVPNQFVDLIYNPQVMLKWAQKFGVFNYQYIAVKMHSLQYRLKSGDWKRENVFKS